MVPSVIAVFSQVGFQAMTFHDFVSGDTIAKTLREVCGVNGNCFGLRPPVSHGEPQSISILQINQEPVLGVKNMVTHYLLGADRLFVFNGLDYCSVLGI